MKIQEEDMAMKNVLTQITVNDLTKNILKGLGYTEETVIAEGEMCILKDTANLSTGGTAEDVDRYCTSGKCVYVRANFKNH